METVKEKLLVLRNSSRDVQEYNQAIVTLRRLGIDQILKAQGEPRPIQASHPQSMFAMATEYAFCRGWNEAVDFMFDLFNDQNFESSDTYIEPDYN